MYQYQQYPQYQPVYQPVPQYQPQPVQPKRRIEFVDGEAGAQAFQLGPGESVALFDANGTMTVWLKAVGEDGVPSPTARYRLTEDDGGGVESRLAAMEMEIGELREALNAKPVPDVRTQQAPRHSAAAGNVASAGDVAGS